MHAFRRTVLAAALVAAGSVTVAPPAVAAEQPLAGDACTTADLGKRWPQIDTVNVEPTITHFTAFFVTEGSTGQQQVTLQVQNEITVRVGRTSEISAQFGIAALSFVAAKVSFVVEKTTKTTSTQTEMITWNFNQPGYYGVYKGTKKVTGNYSGLNCTRVTTPEGGTRLAWVKRETDLYTTFSNMEQGAIRCEDTVPAASLMRRAQEALGCTGTPSRKSAEPAEKTPEVGAEIAAVPPGFTCEATTYRVGLGNGLYWYHPDSEIDLRPYSSSLKSRFGFRLCRGAGEGDLVEYVLMTANGYCLTLHEAYLNTEASTFDDATCRTVDDNQRWYVYRDATNPNTVGIQAKRNGFMLGQNRVADREFIRLYSTGVANGTGTYYLEPLP